MAETDISVLTPQVENLIRFKAKTVFNVPMERADIEQELRIAVVDYCNKVGVERRTMSAIATIVKQRMFKIIRDHVKFEGCSVRTRRVRKQLSYAFSLDTPLPYHKNHGVEEHLTFSHIIEDHTDTHDQRLMLSDFISYFRADYLSAAEAVIFDLMIDGVNKPRFVCEELYGSRDQQMCKTISKHMISIKDKFRQAWRDVYGKRV